MSYSSSAFSELKAKTNCYTEHHTFLDSEIDVLFKKIETGLKRISFTSYLDLSLI